MEESADATYGARLRSHLAARTIAVSLRSGPDDPAPAVRDVKALASRGFPATPPTAVLEAALLLTFVWVVDETAWGRIESHFGLLGPIAAEVDPVLRKHGIAPVAATVFGELRPTRLDAARRLVNVAAGLGAQGFAAIHREIAEAGGGTPATYRTPQAVAELMAGCAKPAIDAVSTVADLYCRHGELVTATVGSAPSADVRMIGRDSATMRRVRMLLIMRGHQVSVEVTGSAPWRQASTFRSDAVVVNPPFNQQLGDVAVTWDYGAPPERRANFAWLQMALRATADQGRAAVLMPVSAAATSDEREREIRTSLVERGAVRAIIRLSSDLFPVSSVDATVWVLGHPRKGASEPRIVMVDATTLKFKTSERERPVFAGAQQIAALVREPFELVSGETRTVMIERAVGPARIVAVPVSVVAAHGYLLTPHTYLSADDVAGAARIRRIEDAGRAAETALGEALVPVSAPTPLLRNDIQDSGYPEGWEVRKLGELCEIKAGPSRLKRSLMATGDGARIPVLRPSSLEARHIRRLGLDRTTEAVARDFADYGLRADDLLVVRVGQVQDVAIVGEDMDGWLFDSNLTRLRVRTGVEVQPRYLLEFLLSRRTSDRIRATASVHVAPTMSAGELAELDVPVPPLEQQQVIVAALVQREARIVSLRRAIRAEEEMRDVLAEALVGGVIDIDGV